MRLAVAFALELYYERPEDAALASEAAGALKAVVARLAPQIDLAVHVSPAVAITRSRFQYRGVAKDVPNHDPSIAGRQTLLLTAEDIGAQGWAGPGYGGIWRRERAAYASEGQGRW